jgi:micrococcal nuclease
MTTTVRAARRARYRVAPGSVARRSITQLLGLVVVVAMSACQSDRASIPPDQAEVITVIDGDTLDVSVQGQRERIRVLGVDTPETKKKDTPIECFGPEASAFTASQFPAGTVVELRRDVEARDQFGRLLVTVRRVSDGFDLSIELVRQGYATVLEIKPNVAQHDELLAAQDEARDAGRGLWSACPSP